MNTDSRTVEEKLEDAVPEEGIAFQVLVRQQRVEIPFSRKCGGLSLTPDEAREMAKLLRIRASQAEGVY